MIRPIFDRFRKWFDRAPKKHVPREVPEPEPTIRAPRPRRHYSARKWARIKARRRMARESRRRNRT